MNLGTVAHAVILENTWAGVVFIDAADFRTKDAKLQRDNALRHGADAPAGERQDNG